MKMSINKIQTMNSLLAYFATYAFKIINFTQLFNKGIIEWLFHIGPVLCPRTNHIGPRPAVLSLGFASAQYGCPWPNMIVLGHNTGPI